MPKNPIEELLSVVRIYTGNVTGRVDRIYGEHADNAALWGSCKVHCRADHLPKALPLIAVA
jgi:hypothetical protein